MSALVELRNITKTYGELVANDRVNLTLNKGEILAVVGENGAGKSTLMKILYGMETPDKGEIYINGERTHLRSPYDAISKGIGMVQQHFMLIEPFNVAENIVYGKEPRKGIFFDRKKAVSISGELCKKYGLHIDPTLEVGRCPVGLQQRVEILKVLYQQADIIIFDEPSAVLTPSEITELLKTIQDLASLGKSIILITHKLNEVMAVADRVIVMRLGKVVKETMKADTSMEEMSFLMVGRQVSVGKIPEQETSGECLRIENLVLSRAGGKNIIDGISIHVDAGEIVGIAGVSGNGQSELIQCITGLMSITGGKITINGNDVSNKTVSEIRDAGCSCIPEDRYLWGCAADAALGEVGIMSHHRKPGISKRGLFNIKGLNTFVRKIMDRFDVRYSGISQKMKELSGGNAQKLIVAREISQESPLLIAAEPTRGLDVGAIEYIHGQIIKKRENGDAVLLISSELSENMALSDRLYVMYEGKVVGEFPRKEATEEKVGLLMMGGKLNV